MLFNKHVLHGSNSLRILSGRFYAALEYAGELPATQVRKGTSIPYISHLMAVASLVLEANGTEDEVIAALLHNTVEDQGDAPVLTETKRRVRSDVAKVVDGCSDDSPPAGEARRTWKERKTRYINQIKVASQSV